MASYTHINEDIINRDVRLALSHSFHAAALPNDEVQLSSYWQQTNTKDWGLTPLEEPDWTINLQAMIEQTASVASTLPCRDSDGSFQNFTSPYFPWHTPIAHDENLPENQTLWLGGIATGTFHGQNEAHEPTTPQLFADGGFTNSGNAIADGNITTPDTGNIGQSLQSMEVVWQALEGAAPVEPFTPSGRYRTFLTPGCHGTPPGLHSAMNPGIAAGIPFRVETKRVYVCTHTGCNKKYSRMPDLRRHYRGSHLDDRRFQCRALGCERAIRGFPRRDKRDVHEKKMHIDIGDGILL